MSDLIKKIIGNKPTGDVYLVDPGGHLVAVQAGAAPKKIAAGWHAAVQKDIDDAAAKAKALDAKQKAKA